MASNKFKKNQQLKEIERKENRLAMIQSNITSLVQNGIEQYGNSAIAQRLSSSGISGGYHFADCLHNIYKNFGYPERLSFYNFWNMYRRNGTAKAIVNTLPNITWLDAPIIVASDRFIADVEFLAEERKLWSRLKGLDKRQRVGRYAGLFIEIKDGKPLNQPVDSVASVESIVAFKPIYESQLEVATTDEDGNPTMFNYNSGATGNRDEKSSRSAMIHPDRIVISAEGADDGSIYGIPALEGCFNSLMDLVKIGGASGEGYYQNTRQAPVINAGKDSKLPTTSDGLKQFEDNLTDYLNDWRKFMITEGMELQFPDISLSDPKEHRQTAINDCSADSSIPNTMLSGSQTGVLAGNKDYTYFLMLMMSRRNEYGTDTTKDVLNRLMSFGALPKERYKVEWSDLLTMSEMELAELADKQASANQKQFSAGQPAIYPVEHIQKSAGVEIELLEMPAETEQLEDEQD